MVVASSSRSRHNAFAGVISKPIGVMAPVSVHMAVIPTAWGTCAAMWKTMEASSGCFAQRPASSLLGRILTPGLSVSDLRQKALAGAPGCTEVLGDGRGNFHPEVVPEWFTELVKYLQSYYTAGLREWTQVQFAANWDYWHPRLDWSRMTGFQKQVIDIVARIPSGAHLTYGQVAQRAGKPAAARAVGMVMRCNPWPVLVPCHRVLGSSGKLTGFSAPGGVETKRRMLEMEKGRDVE